MKDYRDFDKEKNNEMGINFTIYLFSIFSIIKKTLNKVDFNFR